MTPTSCVGNELDLTTKSNVTNIREGLRIVRHLVHNLCKEALASGPLNTRQLGLKIMAAKGLDTGDKVLAKAVAGRLIHALRQQCRRGLIDGCPYRKLYPTGAKPRITRCFRSWETFSN
jgi:hypothetical protein